MIELVNNDFEIVGFIIVIFFLQLNWLIDLKHYELRRESALRSIAILAICCYRRLFPEAPSSCLSNLMVHVH